MCRSCSGMRWASAWGREVACVLAPFKSNGTLGVIGESIRVSANGRKLMEIGTIWFVVAIILILLEIWAIWHIMGSDRRAERKMLWIVFVVWAPFPGLPIWAWRGPRAVKGKAVLEEK